MLKLQQRALSALEISSNQISLDIYDIAANQSLDLDDLGCQVYLGHILIREDAQYWIVVGYTTPPSFSLYLQSHSRFKTQSFESVKKVCEVIGKINTGRKLAMGQWIEVILDLMKDAAIDAAWNDARFLASTVAGPYGVAVDLAYTTYQVYDTVKSCYDDVKDLLQCITGKCPEPESPVNKDIYSNKYKIRY
jgi:hypothetical protein